MLKSVKGGLGTAEFVRCPVCNCDVFVQAKHGMRWDGKRRDEGYDAIICAHCLSKGAVVTI